MVEFRSVAPMSHGHGIRNGYEDIEEISDPDGVVAIICRRRSNGALSVAVFKTYERDGVIEKTNFFGSRHFAAVRRVLDIAVKKVATLEAQMTATQVRR